MAKKYINFDEYLIDQLKDIEHAKSFLAVVCEEYGQDHDHKAFLSALRFIVEAQGGLGKLARKTKLSRQHLYKVLSTKGNPQMSTIFSIMDALGFQITFELKNIKENSIKKVQKRRTKLAA